MKSVFFKKNKETNEYSCQNDSLKMNIDELYILAEVLSEHYPEMLDVAGIRVEADDETVLIWSSADIKTAIEIDFHTQAEEDAFEDAYDQYYEKRSSEVPKIEISLHNYEKIKKKWKDLHEIKPNYIVITWDNSGSLDKVDILGKDELLQEDKQYIKFEHEKYLKWEQAKKEYLKNYFKTHDVYDDSLWKSPSDNEYKEDIEEYYGKKSMPDFECRSYTKTEFALKVKKMIEEGQYPEVIGHWIAYVPINADDQFLESTWEFGNYQGKDYNKTLQDLHDFANKILAQEI